MQNKIGTLMKTRRESLGLSMGDIATQVGVCRSTILRWENGEINSIKHADIVLLSKALYLPISAFFSGEVDDPIEDSTTAKMKIELTKRVRELKTADEINKVSTVLDMIEFERKHKK